LIENNISPLERLAHPNWYVRQQTFIQLQVSLDTFEINPKIFDALPHETNINVK